MVERYGMKKVESYVTTKTTTLELDIHQLAKLLNLSPGAKYELAIYDIYHHGCYLSTESNDKLTIQLTEKSDEKPTDTK
jgi:hypothetical protein